MARYLVIHSWIDVPLNRVKIMNEKFNLEKIDAIVGRHVVIDLTTFDHNEELLDRKQLYGVVKEVTEDRGAVIRLIPSEDEFILPPDLDLFEPAEPGSYRLEPSGEVVENPDFRVKSVIHNPPPEMQVPPLDMTTGGPPVRKA
jgi:hypothetical protein